MIWYLTSVVYMHNNPAFLGPGWIFVMLAGVTIILTVYAGLTFMFPEEQRRIK